MALGLILVTYAHYPDKLLESVARSNETVLWYIHHHGPEGVLYQKISALDCHRNIRVFLHGQNRGLSRSWNDGLHMAFEEDHCEMAFLLNDDLFFLDDGFDTFVRLMREERGDFVLGFLNGIESGGSPYAGQILQQGFACCAVTKRAIEMVGYFDENITPAYFEDLDYDLRCRRLNELIVGVPDVLVEHERSKTGRTDPSLDVQGFLKQNQAYFNLKWNPGPSVFAYPFDNKKFPLKIQWEDRADPYPGAWHKTQR